MLYPCTKCGLLALPGRACPHCGYLAIDEGQAIVDWLAALPVEQRPVTIAAEAVDHWPATLVRSYPGSTQNEAASRFNYEATLLEQAGYRPVSQSWSSGGASIGDYAAFGALAAVRSNLGFLVVTYARGAPEPPAAVQETRPTKRCPDCAEEILVDARICRFCRHEFSA